MVMTVDRLPPDGRATLVKMTRNTVWLATNTARNPVVANQGSAFEDAYSRRCPAIRIYSDTALDRLLGDVAINACGLTPRDISRYVKGYAAHSPERDRVHRKDDASRTGEPPLACNSTVRALSRLGAWHHAQGKRCEENCKHCSHSAFHDYPPCLSAISERLEIPTASHRRRTFHLGDHAPLRARPQPRFLIRLFEVVVYLGNCAATRLRGAAFRSVGNCSSERQSRRPNFHAGLANSQA